MSKSGQKDEIGHDSDRRSSSKVPKHCNVLCPLDADQVSASVGRIVKEPSKHDTKDDNIIWTELKLIKKHST